MRVAFLHPDLGLGGAERLVVDAAVGLVRKGHTVTMYTSHYTPARSFAETRDGSFPVLVAGDWLPRHLFGALHILFAMLRAVWLAVYVALTAPNDVRVFVCDQVSAYVPVLRLLRPRARVLFYCHFPDRLLSPRSGWLKAAYRAPFDALEEACTAAAHVVVVNSRFTRDVVRETFPSLRGRELEVLYPCIDVPPPVAAVTAAAVGARRGAAAAAAVTASAAIAATTAPAPAAVRPLLLSINRFERKKDVSLALRAFALLLQHRDAGAVGAALPSTPAREPGAEGTARTSRRRAAAPAAGGPPPPAPRPHLVIAGGYDTRVGENVEHYAELVALAAELGLAGARGWTADAAQVIPGWPQPAVAGAGSPPPAYEQVQSGADVTFIRSFSDAQKAALLSAATAVVYTPSREHFGIVPLECMAAGRPVIAVASGGPLESVLDSETGFLCEPTPEAFARAMADVTSSPARAAALGAAGVRHVRAVFSRDAFADQLDAVLARMTGGA